MYSVKEVRKLFPMLKEDKQMQGKKLVYLDNCSTTFKPLPVIEAINSYYLEKNANSHRGDYDLMYNMDQEVVKTRETIAKLVNCKPNEVVFTSGTTMSINLIALGYAKKFLNAGDEIVLSVEEHASNIVPWYQIAKEKNLKIVFVPLDEEGKITPTNLEKVMTSNTKIVALAHVSNVLGYELDIKEIVKITHKYHAIFVCDGAQSVPHLKTDFIDMDLDFLCFSAHKMCGPTGIGCLIGKYELLEAMDPVFGGGGMNVDFDMNTNFEPLLAPEKFEAGTLNLAGIIGFKKAVEFILDLGIENIHQHDVELLDYLNDSLKDNDNIIIYNKGARNGIFTFNIKNVFAQDEATLLNSKGIAVRSGQHCAKILDEFLKVKATCRLSTYLYTSKEEIDLFVDAINNGGDILDAYFS